jgi:ubiquitin carboxyl-terminal hydrolase L5
MPPKSKKRKAPAKPNGTTNNGDNALTPPDRNTWPGWVEMESEPAFFNTMLKDMGVHGVKTSEVWSLEDNELAVLPQPVHALIFLFRYRETDKDDLDTECPEHVWYAEQVPEFSCATFALLNIVNNIPGLEMGKDLRNFKEFTQNMTPRLKGEAIDDFTFVKKIHNSFAREADILQADMHMKEKAAKARKRQAVAKAQKTRAENAARKALGNSHAETPKSTRTSGRVRRSANQIEDDESHEATPHSVQSSGKVSGKSPDDDEDAHSGENGASASKTNDSCGTPSKTNGATTPSKEAKSPAIATAETKDVKQDSDNESNASSDDNTPSKPTANSSKKLKLNAPKTKIKLDPNADYTASVENESSTQQPRRSGRQPKPRKDIQPDTQQNEIEVDEDGFHFCAYMPIGDHVWKLDGMDQFPQDMGPIEDGESWLSIAQPVLQGRMAQYAAGAIEFNIMAIVHDPMVGCIEALAANVKVLRAVEEKLADVVEDWRELLEEHDHQSNTLTGQNHSLGLHNVDIERAKITSKDAKALARAEDLTQLLELRKEIVLQQCGLRRACSDEMECAKSDAEKAMSRRHDYSTFAREWLGALAEQEMLGALLEDES